MASTSPPSTSLSRPWLYGAVGCITCATLILELALTRLFSVIMFYHFAFMAISLALFGLGAAGVYLYLKPRPQDPRSLIGDLKRNAGWAAFFTVLALVVILNQPTKMSWSWETVWSVLLLYCFASCPFFFSGMCVTLAIHHCREDMGRLYFFDLVGAGLGCLLLGPFLRWMGGIETILFCAVSFAVAILMFDEALPEFDEKGRSSSWKYPAFAASALIGLWLLQFSSPFLLMPSAKSTHEGQLLYRKWNTFSRVTVERGGRDYLWLKMDSHAATRIFSGSLARSGWVGTRRFWETRISSLAYALREPGKALILGPGGGVDVISALYFGKKQIVGVELNPLIVDDVMKRVFLRYSGGLYLRPGVKILAREGRSYVRSTRQRFQTIQATLVDTWSATAAGALTLSENTLYTREAFGDYLSKLTPHGVLTMTRWYSRPPREFLRLLVLGRAALDDRGIGQHHRHFYLAAGVRMATFVLKKSPFTRREVHILDHYVRSRRLRRLYSPFSKEQNVYARFVRHPRWPQFVAKMPRDLSPPTDDRPFFFYAIKPKDFLSSIVHFRRMNSHDLGLFLLVVLLGIVTLLVALCLLVPMWLFRRSALAQDRRGKLLYLAYFLALGAGFIVVEIAMMQKFISFLGHPTYALLVVLCSVLVFGGVGSLWVSRVGRPQIWPRTLRTFLGLVGLVLAYLAILPPLFAAWSSAASFIKVAASVALLAPLGLLMGGFLPMAIQGAGERFAEVVPWAWGINGAASVLGSIGAMILAMNLGFNWSLCLGLACYGLGMLAARAVLRVEEG